MSPFILITGASSGIGAGAALELVKAGYQVIAGVRNPSDGDTLIREAGPALHPVLMDVTDAAMMQQAKSEVEGIISNQPLVAIINNAGIVIHGAILYIPIEEWQRQLDINVLGVLRTTQLFLPMLAASRAPGDTHPRRIINIGSVSGLFASPFLGPYCASKFALEAITDSLRRELFMYDVGVVLLEPGKIKTPIWEKAKAGTSWFGPEYASILKFKDQIIDSNISSSQPLAVTNEAILHAVRSKKVRNRYLLVRKKWKFRLLTALPSAWIDRMIRKKMIRESGFRPF